MLETGFYPNDKIKLRQLQLRLWRNARVIYDIGMHTEKMTYEELKYINYLFTNLIKE